jgi:hypothetical protein
MVVDWLLKPDFGRAKESSSGEGGESYPLPFHFRALELKFAADWLEPRGFEPLISLGAAPFRANGELARSSRLKCSVARPMIDRRDHD